MAMRSRIWLCTAAAVITLSVSEYAAADRQDVTGRWAGYFDSAPNSASRGPLSISVSFQAGRRFSGEVCFPPDPCAPVMGTVSESGEFNITGRSSQVRNIELHARPLEGHGRGDRAVVGAYRTVRAGGSIDQGNFAVVHQAAEDGVPTDLAAVWGGYATPRGTVAARPVQATLDVDQTGAMKGTLGWSTVTARAAVVGQASRAKGADKVALVALLDDAIVVATLDASTTAQRLDGAYQRIPNSAAKAEVGAIALWLDPSQAHAKQSEAWANLKALYMAEKAYLQEKDVYSTNIYQVGFDPERNNRYRYVLTATPLSLQLRVGGNPPSIIKSPTDQGIEVDWFKFPQNVYPPIEQSPCTGSLAWGITGVPPHVIFTAAAYGNIDEDETLDMWSISTSSRTIGGDCADEGGSVPAGEPFNDVNDVND